MKFDITGILLHEVEPRDVVFVHCDKDSECDIICRDVHKVEPLCYKRYCICDRRYFCMNDFSCKLQPIHCDDDSGKSFKCIHNICNCL